MIPSAAVKRATILLLTAGLLFTVACQSVTVIQPTATGSPANEPAATGADNITAWATVALASIAFFGIFGTLAMVYVTGRQARKRQQLEVGGYIRVDIGPTQGTDDYKPPPDDLIVFIERSQLTILGNASEHALTISVWYRNLQTHPLGVAFGVHAKIAADIIEPSGRKHEVSLTHEIPYVEPGKSVRLDFVRFPPEWEAEAEIEAIKYRNLHWDGATPKHGRSECEYKEGQFRMFPWSDPLDTLWDRADRLIRALKRRLPLTRGSG